MTAPQTICRVNAKQLYWNAAQQLAHLTSVGTPLQIGDLCASGTISGDAPDSLGCLLELTHGGAKPLLLAETGETRAYLQDGDTVTFSGYGQGDGFRVGLGHLASSILSADAH
jgi:fumarylacetoacetase